MKIMNFITKILNVVPRIEREGIAMKSDEPTWKLKKVNRITSFFQALSSFVPDGSMLYLEGGTHPRKLLLFLEKVSIPEQLHIEMGTIWPRPKTFHVPATCEILYELANLSEGLVPQEVAVHIHVYHNGKVILQWYDAFMDNLYISKNIPEDKVASFCNIISSQYE
jgi:hypothetical protein